MKSVLCLSNFMQIVIFRLQLLIDMTILYKIMSSLLFYCNSAQCFNKKWITIPFSKSPVQKKLSTHFVQAVLNLVRPNRPDFPH